MDIFNYIQNLCVPSFIYLLFGLFGVISSYNDASGKIISIIIVFLITYLLDYACKTYGQTTSWYILLILYVFPIILATIMIFVLTKNSSLNFAKSLKSTVQFSPPKITEKISKIISSKISK